VRFHTTYDVIVVGAGHAGNEAAAAAANTGAKTLLVTMNMGVIGQMSCNPAMGGVAKGQIVREVDALGGYSGLVSDHSAIQFRMLNRSKGPAMWSPRTQNDKYLFAQTWREMLEQTEGLDFWQDSVTGSKVCAWADEGSCASALIWPTARREGRETFRRMRLFVLWSNLSRFENLENGNQRMFSLI